MILHGDTIDEVAKNLANMKRWKPYQYGGKFFIVQVGGDFHGLRSKQAAQNKVKKCGGELMLWTIE